MIIMINDDENDHYYDNKDNVILLYSSILPFLMMIIKLIKLRFLSKHYQNKRHSTSVQVKIFFKEFESLFTFCGNFKI